MIVERKLGHAIDPEFDEERSLNTTARDDLKALIAKYGHVLRTVKVLHLNDSLFHRKADEIREIRENRGMFFWDLELIDSCGLTPENITTIQILHKPWLFNRARDEGMHDEQAPSVEGLDPADEAEYYAALEQTQQTFDLLKAGQPVPHPTDFWMMSKRGARLEALVEGATSVGAALPKAADKNCADVLAKISIRLDDKYEAALSTWCARTFSEVDLVCGQGGEVVLTNMAYQCNQPFVKALVAAVHTNQCLYISHSAGTMVTAKSMEMTGEIKPGWLEAFAVQLKYLPEVLFNAVDLSTEDGSVSNSVLGALPLFKSPMAMRPHYSEAWFEHVKASNREAAEECSRESSVDIDPALAEASATSPAHALRLLNLVSATNAKYQQRPIFVPMRDGEIVQCQRSGDHFNKEVFSLVDGTLRPTALGPAGQALIRGSYINKSGVEDALRTTKAMQRNAQRTANLRAS